MSVYSPEWLELREPADAAARARELPELLRGYLPHADLVIRDLGSGTGSLGRWLAGRLPGAQRWILHDHDSDLLARAHEVYRKCGMRARDDASLMRKLDPTWTGGLL